MAAAPRPYYGMKEPPKPNGGLTPREKHLMTANASLIQQALEAQRAAKEAEQLKRLQTMPPVPKPPKARKTAPASGGKKKFLAAVSKAEAAGQPKAKPKTKVKPEPMDIDEDAEVDALRQAEIDEVEGMDEDTESEEEEEESESEEEEPKPSKKRKEKPKKKEKKPKKKEKKHKQPKEEASSSSESEESSSESEDSDEEEQPKKKKKKVPHTTVIERAPMKRYGTKAEVLSGQALMTRGGKTRQSYCYNEQGRIVSKFKHLAGKQRMADRPNELKPGQQALHAFRVMYKSVLPAKGTALYFNEYLPLIEKFRKGESVDFDKWKSEHADQHAKDLATPYPADLAEKLAALKEKEKQKRAELRKSKKAAAAAAQPGTPPAGEAATAS